MWLLPISIIVFTIVIAIPLSSYMAKVMDGKYRAPGFLQWFEKRLDSGPMDWKQYTIALLVFNVALFVYGYIVLSLQPWMPLNPRGLGMLAPTTIFHTVISFITNTNMQHYSGDVAFSNFSADFLLRSEFLSLGRRRPMRPCCHHPRAAWRFSCRQLLRRYVASGGLLLPPSGVRNLDGLPRAGDADDLSERPDGHDA